MGGEFPNCGALSGVSVVDSPILLLVCFHKALRAELSQLHSHATLLSPASLPRSLLLLHQRFTFLRTIYKYHCTAEDEVIFRALDLQVKNVAGTYSLEHNSINDLFDSVFYWLDLLLSNGYSSKSCQELALCTGTLKTSICQHMQKEEEQVFPLLVQRFSFKEQASLAWLFMCSVPLILLEDFLPWMISYLSKDEQEDVLHSIKEVVPKERLLQEVVTSWLGKKSLPFCGSNTAEEDKIASCLDKPLSFKKFPEIHSSKKFFSEGKCHQRESDHLQEIAGNHPIDGLCLWHGVIRKELKEILEELQNMRRFQNFTSLSSISSQIMFIADVLIFYSDALEKVIFPALNECVNVCLSFSHHRLAEESQIHGLLSALQSFNCLNRKPLSKLVEELCWQLESFMIGINQQFEFQELEVLPLICKTFDNEMQLKMLYNSLLMMPLGLLKCMVTWISVHLTEDESKTFLGGIKLTGSAAEIEIACLLHEWLCNAYLGKTSLEIFRKELQELFKTRSSFISDQSDEESGLSLSLNVKPCRRPHTSEVKTNSAGKAKDMKCSPDTCSDLCSSTSEDSSIKLHNSDNCSTSYSSGINLQIFFSETFKKISSFSHFLAGKDDAGTSVHLEPKPIDHIFHFHKALGKDLEYLVTVSANMIEEFDALMEFRQRFHVVQVLYQAHSYAEDEIAFPALEAKGTLQNISGAYTVDHKLEEEHFKNIAIVLDEISELHSHLSSGMTSDEDLSALDPRMPTYRKMCVKLHGMCKSMQTALGHHVFREEVELWPLFLEHFSEEEQETIIGCIIGRTKAEILQAMIPWLMASLSPSEQNTMMSSWRKATKNTMFDEWLGEWWEGMERNDTSTAIEKRTVPSENADPLEAVAAYLSKEGFTVSSKENLDGERCGVPQRNSTGTNIESSIDGNSGNDHIKILKENGETYKFSECTKLGRGSEKKGCQKMVDIVDRANRPMHLAPVSQKFTPHQEHLLTMSQDDLEAAIRKVSQDPTLEPHKRSYLIQNLLMSRWIISQQFSDSEEIISSGGEDVPGRSASYRDPLKSTYGCEHYKRNCKLLTGCCNQLFTCRYCHDNTSDHSMDRKSTTKMMCMKCLLIQPMGPRCSKLSCNGLSMARYFCNICKLFDDEREIYHCPFCNLCRVGKGLGIDYFHCMNCNACMSKSLAVHICREKCFESNCPICHEYIFTSSSPVKALPCGHLMHSTCFQDYTCTHYTCPICSKSLGDMQVYFGMLDVLLAEEKLPQEYSSQTQAILCNDCEKRGTAPFHWLYHKCSPCGSYNTRLL